MTMIKVNIHEAKTHLSHYLDVVEQGESVIICKRNQPVAEIKSLKSRINVRRPIGLAKGQFTVPSTFFDELPDEIISLFQGKMR